MKARINHAVEGSGGVFEKNEKEKTSVYRLVMWTADTFSLPNQQILVR